VQFGLSLRQKAEGAARKVDAASVEETKLQTQLKAERGVLDDLRNQSKDLIEFTRRWEPFFAIIEEQEAAETGISMKVREANMLNLSQRYQQVPHKINNRLNESLPILVRATLLFDDRHAKLLNWLGMMEKIKPTMRVGKVALSKGSRGEDLRMEMVLEVPLKK
jgi:hypothetical protein